MSCGTGDIMQNILLFKSNVRNTLHNIVSPAKHCYGSELCYASTENPHIVSLPACTISTKHETIQIWSWMKHQKHKKLGLRKCCSLSSSCPYDLASLIWTNTRVYIIMTNRNLWVSYGGLTTDIIILSRPMMSPYPCPYHSSQGIFFLPSSLHTIKSLHWLIKTNLKPMWLINTHDF